MWIITLALLLGALLGWGYCRSLWFVCRKLPGVNRPLLWVAFTGTLRVGIVILVFFYAFFWGWQSLVACLLGFVCARTLTVRTKLNHPA